MQFLSEKQGELLDVNDGTFPFLHREATILCNDLFAEVIGEWNGSSQSPNCVSFLCNGKGPRLWLAQEDEFVSKKVVQSPEREKGLYLMFVVPLTENTRAEVLTLADNARELQNKGEESSLNVFGRGFVRLGKGHVFCVFADYIEGRPLRWFEPPQALGIWMEKFYEQCNATELCFDRELTIEDFVVTNDGVLMTRFDKYVTEEMFGVDDRMRFLCALMDIVTGAKFLLYDNTTPENLSRRIRKTLKRDKIDDRGNLLPLIWRVLGEI
nr:hypothetical protein MarFTME_326 [Marseillevirus futianmevirus]